MRKQEDIWVLGGDQRQAQLALRLAADGHRVRTWALELAGPLEGVEQRPDLEGVEAADCVVLPLPVSGEGGRLNAPLSDWALPMEEVLSHLKPGQIICAGRVDRDTAALAERRGLVLRDYFAREELAVANAVPPVLAVGQC